MGGYPCRCPTFLGMVKTVSKSRIRIPMSFRGSDAAGIEVVGDTRLERVTSCL